MKRTKADYHVPSKQAMDNGGKEISRIHLSILLIFDFCGFCRHALAFYHSVRVVDCRAHPSERYRGAWHEDALTAFGPPPNASVRRLELLYK